MSAATRNLKNIARKFYDVIVIGGGHAGCEAAAGAARMGADTLLVTHKFDTIGEMSCNPSFGGIGKGHLMREIDSLDGLCSRICDKAAVQYKVLNTNKGPAVWGLRAQIDRQLYKRYMQEAISNYPNLHILEGAVDDLIIENCSNSLCSTGIKLSNLNEIKCRSAIITTGTFLKAQINIGLHTYPAGRIGDSSAIPLSETLYKLQFKLGRLKTGTPPRLLKQSINYNHPNLKKELGDKIPNPFSYLNNVVSVEPTKQIPCYLTATNAKVHEIIAKNMHLNRHVKEETSGPRYCPSIESKVLRFKTDSHNIWLEPEGFDSPLIYPQGMSCTLPPDLQEQAFRAIDGLENVVITRPGYGVEYDYVDPTQLNPSLETKKIRGLFMAGQINGTTGYEEAAAQGILAGINAAIRSKDMPTEQTSGEESQFLNISRSEGYIGVLVDDLTTLGTNEPYRMFTTRAEFRLHLRPDNADLRLTQKGFDMGCVGEERMDKYIWTRDTLNEARDLLSYHKISNVDTYRVLNHTKQYKPSAKLKTAMDLLQFPHITLHSLNTIFPNHGYETFLENQDHQLDNINNISQRLKIEALYSKYLAEDFATIEALRKDEECKLAQDLDYTNPSLNLSNELKEKLSNLRPSNIAAASRIPGITPDALIRLLRFVKRNPSPISHVLV